MKLFLRSIVAIVFLLVSFSGISFAQNQFDYTVAKDGSGNYKTIQEVIDAVPDFRKTVTKVYIKKGTYKEKVVLPESKQNIYFEGEDLSGVEITFDDYASKPNSFGENMGTSGSSGFFIYGINIRFKNITFSNTAGEVGQAVAVFVAGDKVQFENCRFLGNQDTLYTYGKTSRQYYLNCYIEGTVDFIFGSSTAVFDSCTIYGKRNGYFTAASTPEGTEFGYVFRNCKLTGSAQKGSVKLGRPWRPFAKTVYLNCEMDSVVAPAGWDNWGKTANEQTTLYAEYKSKGTGANSSQRVTWAKILTDSQAAVYTLDNIFKDWKPSAFFTAVTK